MGELVVTRRLRAEWAVIGQQTRNYLREPLGYDPDERTAWEAELAEVMADLDRQFAARRRPRPATA